jgi:hypothetical protein
MPKVGEEFGLFESRSNTHIDDITIIGTVEHPDGRLEIKTRGKEKEGETEFFYDETIDLEKWLVLHRDPITNERCFSAQGSRYLLRPIQKN